MVAGAEPAQVARWTQLYKQKKPVLFYWYDPQYLNAQYDLVQVQLPSPDEDAARTTRRRVATPKKYACAYPSYRLDKLVSKEFLDERLAGAQVHQEVQVDGGRSEHRREPHLRQEAEAGQGCGEVGQGQPARVNAWLK